LQLVVVLFSGSVALLGDTLHNFADALTALPLWLAFVLERRPPNRRYTYGYGRAEDLAGVFIVAMIALSAVVAGWESVLRLLHPYRSGNLPWVIIAAVIGFLLNELVALYRIRVGRDIASAALVADGLHARSDGLTSLAVLVGAIGVAAGFQRADPIVGLLITVAILFVLKSAARDIYDRLMDLVAPELWTGGKRPGRSRQRHGRGRGADPLDRPPTPCGGPDLSGLRSLAGAGPRHRLGGAPRASPPDPPAEARP